MHIAEELVLDAFSLLLFSESFSKDKAHVARMCYERVVMKELLAKKTTEQ